MKWFRRPKQVTGSILLDEHTFYQAFIRDLERCESETIIESPFITTSRMKHFDPIFQNLLNRNVRVNIVTRDPSEHDGDFRYMATDEVLRAVEMGIQVTLLTGNHHRKLAIIDRKILWEGSLNILSQTSSKEVMRRINSEKDANKMIYFLDQKGCV